MVSSMALLYSLGPDNQNEVQHDLFGHSNPSVLMLVSCESSSIINGPLHSLGQDDGNEVQHDIFWTSDANTGTNTGTKWHNTSKQSSQHG